MRGIWLAYMVYGKTNNHSSGERSPISSDIGKAIKDQFEAPGKTSE
jgi:hypothetical protein